MSSRRLRAEVDVSRMRELQSGGIVAKKREEICDAPSADDISLFEAMCRASAPFITVSFLRRLADGSASFPRRGRTDVPENEFRFPVGGTPSSKAIFAVLSPAAASGASATDVDSQSREAGEILESLQGTGYACGDDDLLFWPFLCMPTEPDALAREQMSRIFSQYSVQTILRCSPARSVVRLA